MLFFVKDGHWRICMNSKAFQWLLSVGIHRMECMKIRAIHIGVVMRDYLYDGWAFYPFLAGFVCDCFFGWIIYF